MKFRKAVSIIASLTIVLSSAACNSSSSSSQTQGTSATATAAAATTAAAVAEEAKVDPETGLTYMADADDPITYKLFMRDPGVAPSKDNPVLNKITELTGVTFEYEYLVGDLDQKIGVMIAGGDYPDFVVSGDKASKFIEAGAFIPLEDYLPEYSNLYDHYSPFLDKLTTEDGHHYILEIYSVIHNAAPKFKNTGVGFFIQKAVLEDAGYPIPTTLDEYFTLIEDYMAKYPEIDGVKTIGFEVLSDDWRAFCLTNPSQHLMGAGNDGAVYVDLTTLEASHYQTSDTAYNYYKKLNQEYHKGVIEAETFTQSYDQYISRITTGAVLGFFDQGWNFIYSGEDVLYNDGKFDRTYVAVPITNPGVQDGYLDADGTSVTGINGLGITVNCENPERLLAFYDWLLQRDVQDYLQWGEEGVDHIVTEGGGKALTAERRAIVKDVASRRDLTGDSLWQICPKRQGLYDDGSPCSPDDSEDEYLAQLSDYDQAFLQKYGFNYPAEFLSEPVVRPNYYPVWSMVIEDGSAASIATTKTDDVCKKFYPRLIICAEDEYDALWEDFLEEFAACNPEAYLTEVNRQIKLMME